MFQGTGDGRFVAYRAATGEKLWEAPTGTGVVAPPVSYSVDGTQYIALLVGWGGVGGLSLPQFLPANGTSRLLVYTLGGTASHPVAPKVARMQTAPPEVTGSTAAIERGSDLFIEHCARCHGSNVGEPGALPDLRYMSADTRTLFNAIVLEGAYSGVGMVRFDHLLSESDTSDLLHYLTQAANDTWEQQQDAGWWQSTTQWVLTKAGAAIGYFMQP